MKLKQVTRGQPLTPEQVIAYLTYALEDVQLLSPRSTFPLAHAIAMLTEDTLWTSEVLLRSGERDGSVH